MLDLDIVAAQRIGAAFIALVWSGPSLDVEVAREGHVYFAKLTSSNWGSDADITDGTAAVAIDATDGRLVGGSFFGVDRARKELRHRVYRATTALGLNVTSVLGTSSPGTDKSNGMGQEAWATILARAKPAPHPRIDRSPVVLKVEELLGPKWSVARSGRAFSNGKSLVLDPRDAKVLRSLAALRPIRGKSSA